MATSALLACGGASHAQTSSGLARIIVPFAAGGAREMPARLIQHDFNEATGQNWIIENRPGAGGAIGTVYVAKQPPAGDILLMAASSHFVTAAMGAKPFYEPVKDFAPVALIGKQSYVLIVQAALNIHNVTELIAYGKAHAGVMNYNSAGIASSTHLAGAYFANLAGIEMTHIPFKGTAEATNDVVGGRGHLTFVPAAGAGIYLADKRVRIIATTAAKRSQLLPDIPTVSESGLPKYQFESWFGLLAPARTPAEIVSRQNAAVNYALAVPGVRSKLLNFGIEPDPVSVAEFNRVFLADQALMASVVKTSGITKE